MISFIISLCVVDNSQRAWRVAQNEGNTGLWGLSRLAPLSWWNAEPYQRFEDATWQSSGDMTNEMQDSQGIVPVPNINTEKWFTHKKHRRMARWELGEALEMRSRMAVALVVWVFVGAALMAWIARGLYSFLQGRFV